MTHERVMTWRNQPTDCKHVWAFVYYCRRQGDTVQIEPLGKGKMHVTVIVDTGQELARRSREEWARENPY